LTLESDEGELVTVLGSEAPLRARLMGQSSGSILDDIDLTILEVM
jgi:hypothetical protein